MKKELVVEIISMLLVILFVYAGTYKLLELQTFRIQIGQSPLLTSIAPYVAIFIPIVEIMVALMLAVRKFRLLGLHASFFLMTMFTLYIVAILNFSDNIPCSCGGVLEELGWTEHLIFNIVFVVLALVGIAVQSKLQQKEEAMPLSE